LFLKYLEKTKATTHLSPGSPTTTNGAQMRGWASSSVLAAFRRLTSPLASFGHGEAQRLAERALLAKC
jgi:hypothetical protein